MNFDPKVVPFDRSAAYVHHRAMKNRRDNNVVDALELLRRAVEHSPNNDEYKLDLAELLSEMGCLSQSNRLLLDMLSDRDAPTECYYGLALNLLSQSDIPGAKRALRRYKGLDPHGVHADEVRRITDELQFYEMLSRPLNRRSYRAARVADLACERMKEEDFRAAARLFERSLGLEPARSEIRALYATALELLGMRKEALQQARMATEAEVASVRAICVVAQMYHMADMGRKSRQMALKAMSMRPTGIEMRMLIYTLGELSMHKEVGECARLSMQETPYDRQLLHIRAVALIRTGAQEKQAMKFWARILRIDPEDTIAGYYMDAAAAGNLKNPPPDYAYQVPKDEAVRRLSYVADTLSRHYNELERVWQEDKKFRALLKWCLTVDNAQFRRASITALAALKDEEAEGTLREVFMRPEIAYELKLNALMLLRMRGADMGKLLPPSIDERDGLLPDPEPTLDRLPIGFRQAVKYASEVLEDEYGVTATTALALIMLKALSSRQMVFCTRDRIPAYAAALLYCYLSMRGEKPSFRKLCRQFGSPFRRTVYYAQRMADAMEEDADGEPDGL